MKRETKELIDKIVRIPLRIITIPITAVLAFATIAEVIFILVIVSPILLIIDGTTERYDVFDRPPICIVIIDDMWDWINYLHIFKYY